MPKNLKEFVETPLRPIFAVSLLLIGTVIGAVTAAVFHLLLNILFSLDLDVGYAVAKVGEWVCYSAGGFALGQIFKRMDEPKVPYVAIIYKFMAIPIGVVLGGIAIATLTQYL